MKTMFYLISLTLTMAISLILWVFFLGNSDYDNLYAELFGLILVQSLILIFNYYMMPYFLILIEKSIIRYVKIKENLVLKILRFKFILFKKLKSSFTWPKILGGIATIVLVAFLKYKYSGYLYLD